MITQTIPQKALLIILTAIVTLFIGKPALSQPQTMDKEPSQESSTDQGSDQSSSDTTSMIKPRKMIDTEAKATELLMEAVEQDNVNWLMAEGEKFMTLWQPDKTDNPFGAVLILHGEGQSAEWPNTVSAIRNNLSQHGWGTLAISLPLPHKTEIPKRPAAHTIKPKSPDEMSDKAEIDENKTDKSKEDAKATDMENKAAMADLEKEKLMDASSEKEAIADMAMKKDTPDPEVLTKARLNASIQFLNEQGQYNLVIVGHGIGAIRAAKFIKMLNQQTSENTPQASAANVAYKIRALIMVSARNHILNTEEKLIPYLKDIPIPILDAYYGDHYLDSAEVSMRKRKVQTSTTKNYYQVKITHPNSSDASAGNRLTRRIRGFLNKHAKGVEIER